MDADDPDFSSIQGSIHLHFMPFFIRLIMSKINIYPSHFCKHWRRLVSSQASFPRRIPVIVQKAKRGFYFSQRSKYSRPSSFIPVNLLQHSPIQKHSWARFISRQDLINWRVQLEYDFVPGIEQKVIRRVHYLFLLFCFSFFIGIFLTINFSASWRLMF